MPPVTLQAIEHKRGPCGKSEQPAVLFSEELDFQSGKSWTALVLALTLLSEGDSIAQGPGTNR